MLEVGSPGVVSEIAALQVGAPAGALDPEDGATVTVPPRPTCAVLGGVTVKLAVVLCPKETEPGASDRLVEVAYFNTL